MLLQTCLDIIRKASVFMDQPACIIDVHEVQVLASTLDQKVQEFPIETRVFYLRKYFSQFSKFTIMFDHQLDTFKFE